MRRAPGPATTRPPGPRAGSTGTPPRPRPLRPLQGPRSRSPPPPGPDRAWGSGGRWRSPEHRRGVGRFVVWPRAFAGARPKRRRRGGRPSGRCAPSGTGPGPIRAPLSDLDLARAPPGAAPGHNAPALCQLGAGEVEGGSEKEGLGKAPHPGPRRLRRGLPWRPRPAPPALIRPGPAALPLPGPRAAGTTSPRGRRRLLVPCARRRPPPWPPRRRAREKPPAPPPPARAAREGAVAVELQAKAGTLEGRRAGRRVARPPAC
jgi:hypothetical protein